MAYYVGYQRGLYPYDQIDFSALTHLAVGRVVPNSNGTLNTSFDIGSNSDGIAMAVELSNRTHQAGKKAILMVGGADVTNQWISATSNTNRATFVSELVSFAKNYGYDGFDLDWEPLDSAYYPAFGQLVSALRTAMPGVILTFPTFPINVNYETVNPNLVGVAPQLDQINLMTYGMAGAYQGWNSWHSSPIYGESPNTPNSNDSSIKRYIQAGIPASKIGMGIGFYGQCYSAPVTGPRQALNGSQIVASDNAISYTNIMTQYFNLMNFSYDTVAKAPYLGANKATGPYGCTYISYENEQSIEDKGAYAKANGLGGSIIWTINQGYLPNAGTFEQRNTLMEAVKRGFLQ